MSEVRLPLVAIVGRPNVGKSTLFNRYAGRRRALVEDIPGVTRDRIVEEVEAAGRSLLLVDTAGLDPVAEEGLPAAVQAQAWSAVEDADAILFLVDGQAGLLPEDQQIARTLRRTAKPIALLVNKTDLPQHEDRVGDFYSLGFEQTVGVSAAHGRGAWDALEDLMLSLPESPPAEPLPEGTIRIAIVGRPNVGKSSLANRIAGEQRVVVSDVPGTTRDTVDIHIDHEDEHYVLVDTAGLRRPGRRIESTERTSALMTVRALERADVAFVLVDAEEGLTDQDAKVAALARERGRAVAVLANKWDLVPGEEAERFRENLEHSLRFMPDAPVMRISALRGSGLKRLFPTARKLYAAARRRISTADLNRWLEDATKRHEPAMAQRGRRKRPLKFFYATQASVAPPTFVLFCTDPQAVQPSYRRFLENRLRERFDLEGTPVRIRLRTRSGEKKQGGGRKKTRG
jgi:GTP-binding protein